MNKAQKMIVAVGALLIVASAAFPPYATWIGDSSRTVPDHSGWAWIGNVGVPEKGYDMRIRFDMLALEIFGIVVLVGAALLVLKKKP